MYIHTYIDTYGILSYVFIDIPANYCRMIRKPDSRPRPRGRRREGWQRSRGSRRRSRRNRPGGRGRSKGKR